MAIVVEVGFGEIEAEGFVLILAQKNAAKYEGSTCGTGHYSIAVRRRSLLWLLNNAWMVDGCLLTVG